jgi:uncharacterized membrane protein
VIIPGHWELVKAKKEAASPTRRPGIVGKQRSVHNSYLTLPVLFTMLAGPLVVHVQPRPRLGRARRADGRRRRDPPLLQPAARRGDALVDPVGCALAIAAIAVWLRPPDTAPAHGAADRDLRPANQIVQTPLRALPLDAPDAAGLLLARPRTSSSTRPSRSARSRPDQGRAVDSTFMPLGNATHMTDAERKTLGQWIAAGAK